MHIMAPTVWPLDGFGVHRHVGDDVCLGVSGCCDTCVPEPGKYQRYRHVRRVFPDPDGYPRSRRQRAHHRDHRSAQEQQWAIEAERRRQEREAKERRQEQVAAADRERLRQEQHERQTAQRWWQELSANQIQQLRAAVADPLWKKDLTRMEFDPQGPTTDYGYGIAIYVRRRLHGILRPSPASLRRLTPAVPVYVRNPREAKLLIDTGTIEPARVVHLNLPDHEQIALIQPAQRIPD
jgi:hypothetical protein